MTGRHRGWAPVKAGRLGVPTVLTGFPQVRTSATRRVRVTGRRRDHRSQAARAAAWLADQTQPIPMEASR